jgi:hypothetical protein
MESRLALSVRAFYVGLLALLAAGVGWAVLGRVHPMLPPGLMLGGAMMAIGARAWSRRLQRAFRQEAGEGFGGYPMRVLRDPRFMSRRRSVA